jgi:UDP-N-acetylmuramyl pentapeptide phosphotransferase/UDP-N-acetylglucosamine-1-phosphate transferase
MDTLLQIIAAFLLGLIMVYFFIPVIVRISHAKNLFDIPNERKLNTTRVPNLGGIALFIAISVATLIFIYKLSFDDYRYIQAAMMIMFIIGVKDDVMAISPRKKMIAQFVSAFILVVGGNIRLTNLHGLFGIYEINYAISLIISLLVIVSIINALNLIDGIDGLASSIGILASLFFCFQFIVLGGYNYAIVAFATTGSLIAFFFYNVFGQKNKIFMGDSGSLLLGLIFAVFFIRYNELSLTGNSLQRNYSPVFSLAVLGLPVFDMFRLFVIRVMKKKSPFSADTGHIHHTLLKLGYSHIKSTLILSGATLGIVSIIFVLRNINNNILLLILLVLTSILFVTPKLVYEFKKLRNSKSGKLEQSFFYFTIFMKKPKC